MLSTAPQLSRRAAGAAGGSPTSSRATQPHDTSRQPTSSSGSLCALPTPQQALDAACHHLQLARTDIEVLRCVGALALALGARRTEVGTIKALHAVLLQRVQPGMSNVEAWTSTGASMSSFAKWRRLVHSVPVAPPLKRRFEKRLGVGTRRLEMRMEQLQVERERRLHDVQRRGCPLDNVDDCSAVRRGQQVRPSQPYHPGGGDADSSEAGSPLLSYSPPPSPPPGPPSSTSTARPFAEMAARSAIAHPSVPLTSWGGADRRRLAERACEWSRVLAVLAAPSTPSAAEEASSGQEQLAVEALVDMATDGGAVAAQQSAVRTVQQRSSAAPNRSGLPMLRAAQVLRWAAARGGHTI